MSVCGWNVSKGRTIRKVIGGWGFLLHEFCFGQVRSSNCIYFSFFGEILGKNFVWTYTCHFILYSKNVKNHWWHAVIAFFYMQILVMSCITRHDNFSNFFPDEWRLPMRPFHNNSWEMKFPTFSHCVHSPFAHLP